MDSRAVKAAHEAARRASLTLEAQCALAPYTSLGIGGPAAALCAVSDIEGLCRGLRHARELGVPVLLLGAGTNLLVSDEGWPGLALRLQLTGLVIDHERCTVRVAAGVKSRLLVEETIAASLAGLEFASGLPGTVGGAVAGNAGCFGGSFGDRLIRAMVVDAEGNAHSIEDPAWFHFSYRGSRLIAEGAVLAEATFALCPGDREALQSRAAELLGIRRDKHPLPGEKTAGSYFKNLPPEQPGGRRRAAGELLDAVGAKAMRVGDAIVFERHANIIVNRGAASARDVLELADQMSGAVRRTFGIVLEPEVRLVGPRPAG
ncbi:MAG: UDP-N-acetylmuramate dehydrogenase [Myxococcota bacterium]|jgi:UDP-N-acetylmuramate dehydrogenase|nr:UDP-N-acetylmuramate dehydrogenase [Myxococcota bacterium]